MKSWPHTDMSAGSGKKVMAARVEELVWRRDGAHGEVQQNGESLNCERESQYACPHVFWKSKMTLPKKKQLSSFLVGLSSRLCDAHALASVRACRARVAIEAGVTGLWWKYVGLDGKVIGIDRFGLSAPGGKVMEVLGITPQAVVDAVKAL